MQYLEGISGPDKKLKIIHRKIVDEATKILGFPIFLTDVERCRSLLKIQSLKTTRNIEFRATVIDNEKMMEKIRNLEERLQKLESFLMKGFGF